MSDALHKFWELAETKLKYAGKKDKTINIKIAINTARMMVESEKLRTPYTTLKENAAHLEMELFTAKRKIEELEGRGHE